MSAAGHFRGTENSYFQLHSFYRLWVNSGNSIGKVCGAESHLF
ncbi:hypothetical protein BN2497_2115 [Janthinobacterium sp. CG23_2]|nr:hypothetical protein BN2497_2115 [Janthinobacterium sp. CG23_2]CUU27455.1 hypothetical protein BN3177_2115 [Janthinobacterium sp. CG23_2]